MQIVDARMSVLQRAMEKKMFWGFQGVTTATLWIVNDMTVGEIVF